MRPFSKFAVYLALAGALVLLFARFPKSPQKSQSPQPSRELEQSAAPPERHTLRVPGPVAGADKDAANIPAFSQPAATRAQIPAIRGTNNYGWVQLPRGTQVDFVRRDGRDLWVRWDGTVVKIDSSHAANGAVVLRRPAAARSSRG